MAYWTKPNHTFVPEYQQSSLPYVTSSNGAGEVTDTANAFVKIDFPGVTRWVEIRNVGAGDLRVGFTAQGVLGQGAVTGSNPIDGKDTGTIVGYAPDNRNKAVHKNYFVLSSSNAAGADSTCRWELKCTQLFFRSNSSIDTDFSVVAGITTVPKNMFVELTGSSGFRGVG